MQISVKFVAELNAEADANYFVVSEGENDALAQIVLENAHFALIRGSVRFRKK